MPNTNAKDDMYNFLWTDLTSRINALIATGNPAQVSDLQAAITANTALFNNTNWEFGD
ncbi:hypothetical protein O9H85_31640 [Paenibacillus filicis]|uniref:Uncharacterized protein n=1 Tax=Paenibacillus gyeongsangnamensis TaxID=3388067 RepID=A0ABT4QJ07_9BACL|nr:hypothetical protein [Paenibacillus filicis]MCZ8516838.1 hypothetical protein [Paenibacillus filicis]